MSIATTKADRGQVSDAAAVVYETLLVPALFAEWASPLCDAAHVGPGMEVLDVACGTGVAAREAHRLVEPGGAVTGLDLNEGMLAVARNAAPRIGWRTGAAEMLPLTDATFDAVICQFGLMFFDDRAAALREMARVLRPGGRAAVAVWHTAEDSPGWSGMIRLLDRLIGRAAGDALRAPFALGRREDLGRVLEAGGWSDATVTSRKGMARFPSMADWVRINVRGWTFSDMVDDGQETALVDAAQHELAALIRPDGSVLFEHGAYIATLAKP